MISEAIGRWLTRHQDQLIAIRRDLHAHPELSDAETRTTAVILDHLRAAGLQPRRLPSGTGCVVDIAPVSDKPGLPRIAFRGDIDALPITEDTGLEFSSTTPGVCHACGHDVHATVILGLALALAAHPPSIHVRLIFQPREEVMGGGALDVIAAGELAGVDRVFALHCDPQIPVGQVGVRAGAITSAGDTVDIRVRGGGGHSSRPQLTVDTVYALSSIVTQLPGILTRRLDPRSGTVCVFGAIHAGDAANAIPEEGTLRGTLRTADRQAWEQLEPLTRAAIDHILAPLGARYEIDYRRGVPAVVNDVFSAEVLARAVTSVDPKALTGTEQSSGGEDFGWMTEQVPGAMARLGTWDGVSERTELHRANFTVDERAIGVGVRLFVGVIDEFTTAWRARPRAGLTQRDPAVPPGTV